MSYYAHTVWTRLAPQARNHETTEALRAEIHDPAWLLSRQWQLGEFQLEDAGSPVDARVSFDTQEVTRVRLGDGEFHPYDVERDGPLEALVEREAVAIAPGAPREGPVGTGPGSENAVGTTTAPSTRVAGESGMTFLRLLTMNARKYAPETEAVRYAVSDFPEEYHLRPPTGEVDAAGRRYAAVVARNALDGWAVFSRLVDVPGLEDAVGWEHVDWSGIERAALPLPEGGVIDKAFMRTAKQYVDWYRTLYDEPSDPGDTAWDPTRLEYRFAVTVGDGPEATTFEAREYAGGRLDWYDFSLANESRSRTDEGESRPGSEGATDPGSTTDDTGRATKGRHTESVSVMPTSASFRGMPAPRWWEFEDGAVNLDTPLEQENLAWILMVGYAHRYGNDWFTFPLDVPVGTLVRVSEFSVVDAFGKRTEVEPLSSEYWDGFMFYPDRKGHPASRPGLFVPPAIADDLSSGPVERVVVARDEMANLVFGIEEVVESPVGTQLNRHEYRPPTLSISSIVPAETPDDEHVEFTNVGDAPLPIGGWTVGDGSGTKYAFPDGFVLNPDSAVVLHTGGGTETEFDLYWGRDTAVWSGAREITVYESDADLADGDRIPDSVILRERLVDPVDPSYPDYRLVTDVPRYWYPFAPDGTHKFVRAQLLDADALGLRVDELPTPIGRVLNSPLPSGVSDRFVYDEEVTRAGTEVTRTYQLARWIDGSTHLWSGRRTTTGNGEVSSALRFDYLDHERSVSAVASSDESPEEDTNTG